MLSIAKNTQTARDYDVLIIGGGPAGSAAGAFLAKQGRSVLIVEREVFPRFHIGESLIPFGNEILKSMGVWPKLESAGFMVKKGAEFTLSNSCGFQRFWFRNNLKAPFTETFQVERSRFDTILLDQARENGCTIAQPARVLSAEFSDSEVTLKMKSGDQEESVRASYVIDASGRDAWIGKQLQLPKSDLGMPKKMAIYAHFENAYRNEGEAGGHITIIRMEEGWFWMIPLDEKKTSVGVVYDQEKLQNLGSDLKSRFWNRIHSSKEASFRLKSASLLGDFYATTDYTYRFHQNAGNRWLMAGDSGGFIDPIFSSGVMVALKSGHLAAETILKTPLGNSIPSTLQKSYTKKFHQMTGVFLKMIRLFYDNDAFAVFMNPRSLFQLRETINQLVAGQTDMRWSLRWRFWIFRVLSKIQRKVSVAPKLIFTE